MGSPPEHQGVVLILGLMWIGGGRQSPSPAVLALAPPIDGGLELALVHLRAALDSETLSLAVKLLLRALCSLRHE